MKYSANAVFFGLRRDRFVEYQPNRTLPERFALISQVPDITGVELKYPFDFGDPEEIRELLRKHNLELVAVNVDLKDIQHFRFGALSAVAPEARRHAIRLLQEGMDIAADFNCSIVTTCPIADGYDYPFQVDHRKAWTRFLDSVGEAVSHRRDVDLLLEYQAHEPHARVLLDTVGKSLFVCAEIDAPNLGINLDIGHSFAAQESPAEAAALLASKGRLRYLHSNDNTGEGGDWDMVSGTVHFWGWLELLLTLREVGYEGWMGGDICAKHFGPVDAFQLNCTLISRFDKILDRVGVDRLTELRDTPGNTKEVYELLTRWMED